MIHYLKILPEYFDAVDDGIKTFEIRKNDRGYRIGDVIELREYIKTSSSGYFTGRAVKKRICYITDYEQKPGYIVFGFTDS